MKKLCGRRGKANDNAVILRLMAAIAQRVSSLRFFGLKTCDTCRKALVALRAAGHAPEVIDVRADGIAAADLDAMLAAFGVGTINRSSATWRALTEMERMADPAVLIAAHPTLLKRPVIELDGTWHQGWTQDTQAALLE